MLNPTADDVWPRGLGMRSTRSVCRRRFHRRPDRQAGSVDAMYSEPARSTSLTPPTTPVPPPQTRHGIGRSALGGHRLTPSHAQTQKRATRSPEPRALTRATSDARTLPAPDDRRIARTPRNQSVGSGQCVETGCPCATALAPRPQKFAFSPCQVHVSNGCSPIPFRPDAINSASLASRCLGYGRYWVLGREGGGTWRG